MTSPKKKPGRHINLLSGGDQGAESFFRKLQRKGRMILTRILGGEERSTRKEEKEWRKRLSTNKKNTRRSRFLKGRGKKKNRCSRSTKSGEGQSLRTQGATVLL